MAYIQTINGGFTKDDQGNLTPYQAPAPPSAPSSAPAASDPNTFQPDDTAPMRPGVWAGTRPLDAARSEMSRAREFLNSLNKDGGTGGGAQNPLIPGLPQNPYQENPSGTDIQGNKSNLNPRNFASLEAANALAKKLGANVVATNYDDAMRSPEYNLDFGRGSALNAGLLAARFNTNDPTRDKFWDSEYWRNKALEDELRYNSSPMEDEIRNDRSGREGQLLKDVEGGYQSFKPGGSAGSFSDASHWQTTGPVGQTFVPGGSNANLTNMANQPYSATNWQQRLPGYVGGGAGGAGG